MDEYKADNKILRALYEKLTVIGCGQYAGGHYVAASSLVYASTLRFLLYHFNGENFSINSWNNYNSSLFISDRLIKYFGRGESGEVNY